MGIYSTKFIKRHEAISIIQANLQELDNKKIDNILFEVLGDKYFNNYIVVDDYNDFIGIEERIDPDIIRVEIGLDS